MCFSPYSFLTYQDCKGSEGKEKMLFSPHPSTVSLNLIPVPPSELANSHRFLSLNRLCSRANVLPSSIFNMPSPGFFPCAFCVVFLHLRGIYKSSNNSSSNNNTHYQWFDSPRFHPIFLLIFNLRLDFFHKVILLLLLFFHSWFDFCPH